ncbi:MAG: hypothetical protein KIT84_01770 [Labilithrix sp.]|nr:hypothetical protein [Labilithrix sp.]MCW5809715.1 hypothetical protein [Labilithrix sp.]
MVSSLRLALALVGCLSLVGCAAEPVTRAETPVPDSETETETPGSTSRSDDSRDEGDGTLPVTPVFDGDDDDVSTTEDRLPPAQGGEQPAKPPKSPGTGTTPAPQAPVERTETCPSTAEGHTSLATISWKVTDGLVTITKMTILVTNKDGRDQNDADIFFKPSGGGEQKMFWTGDTLASGKTVDLAEARKLTPKAGTVLRVETNFDKRLLADPSASCTVTLL